MTMTTKHEIIKDKLSAYLKANKVDKGKILDQITGVTGSNPQVSDSSPETVTTS